MPPLLLLLLQIASSFVVMGLFAALVIAPRLRGLPVERALPPLLWMHTLRYVPLALLAPGQTAPDVPFVVAHTIAWGDFAAALLAVAALIALDARGGGGVAWAWLFTVVSSLDLVSALVIGLGSGVYERSLGVSWYVLTLYVPLVCISQVMITAALVRQRSARHASPTQAVP